MQIEEYVTNRLQSLCNKHRMTRYRLSKTTGLSQTAISKIFSGKTLPNLYSLLLICEALGITISQFFSENDTDSVALTEEQRELITIWASRPSNKQDLLLKFVHILLESEL